MLSIVFRIEKLYNEKCQVVVLLHNFMIQNLAQRYKVLITEFYHKFLIIKFLSH